MSLLKPSTQSMQGTVPELDFTDYVHGAPSTRQAFSTALMRGLQRYGFIILRNHPVASALVDQAYTVSAQFFGQSEAVKRRYVGGARGYAPYRTEHAKNHNAPDLKEFWQIGPERARGIGDRGDGGSDGGGEAQAPNIWPEWPPQFKDTGRSLFAALQNTGQTLLEALTANLQLPQDFFASRLLGCHSVLRLIHYPPVGADAAAGGVRSAAHEDINLITLLPAPRGPGLELLDRDGQWLSIETSRNNLIVDAGDMLARLTNDVIPATTHRVVNPATGNVSRYSLPFFMHPDPQVILRCLPSCLGAGAKYPDIRAGTFLEQRLRDIGLIPADPSADAAS